MSTNYENHAGTLVKGSPAGDAAHRLVDSGASAFSSGVDRVRDGVDRSAEALKRQTERTREAAHHAVGQVESGAEQARAGLRRIGDHTLSEVADGAVCFVRKHPRAVALAAASVLLLPILRRAVSRS
jgi:hypothetical protein